MAENQTNAYISILGKDRTPQQKQQDIIRALHDLANPQIKPGEHTVLTTPERGRHIVELKQDPEKQQQTEAETRAMFAELKRERAALDSREVAYINTPHRDVLSFLPPFLQNIARQEQASVVYAEGATRKHGLAKEIPANVIDNFMKYVVDQGIAREQRFGDEVAPGVEILNRAAFSTFVLKDRERRRQAFMEHKIIDREKFTQESLDDDVDQEYTFRQIDIKDFRASDFAKDADQNSGADFTINKVAQHLNKMVGRVNRIFKSQGLDAMIVPCRYGGDELGIGFLGVGNSALRDIIYSAVTGLNETDDPEKVFENGIKQIEGYFNRGGEIKREHVDLKAGLEEISVPKDKAKKKIFWEQFGIGLILNSEEIADIQEARRQEQGVSLAVGKQEAPSFETKEEFATYAERLVKRHPELAEAAKIMVDYSDDMPEVMTEFPKFVQEILYDRLLGEKVTGFQDCVDHMVRGDMKELYMFDMKGIKEFNDVQSLAVGDQAIATLWNHIANSLGEDFDKVMCFRRGSTFVVGIRKDADVAAQTRQKLDGLRSIAFQGHSFDIGYNHKDVGKDTFVRKGSEAQNGETDVRVTIEDLIVNTHEAWNRTVIDQYLIKDPGLLAEAEVKKGKRFTPEEGLSLFFNGKRAIERYERCLEVCAGMEQSASRGEAMGSTAEQYQQLHDTLQKNLFDKVFPKKLKEAQLAGDANKILEISNNWKRLLAKQGYDQDLKQYGIS